MVHKDYSSGIPIQISVYDDRIVLWNPGDLPENWTLKKLLGKHPSCPFNPLLANAFFRAGYIESWGRGIEKIHRECREHRIEPPVYDFDMAGLMLSFRADPALLQAADQGSGRTITTQETRETAQEAASRGAAKTSVEASVEMSVKTPVKTPERVLGLLRENPTMTLAEVARVIGKTSRTVERTAAKFVEEGRLRYVGPRKGGHWEVLA